MLERYQAELRRGFPSGPEAHEWVRVAARQSRTRVTLIDASGLVVSDSDVEASRLPTLENHLGRPEVVAARANEIGFAERRSTSVVKALLYVARRVGPAERPAGYVRIAVPKSILDAEEAPFRAVLTRTSLGSGLLVALLVFVIRRRHAIELDGIREGIVRAAGGNRPDPFPGGTEEGQDVFVALTRFSDLVRAQKEGSESARVLARTVFDEVPVGLVVVDRGLAVLEVNPAARALFALPPSFNGGALHDVVRDPAVLRLFSSLAAGEIRDGGPLLAKVEVRERGERLVEIEGRALPGASAVGEPAAIGVAADVTERERTEGMRRQFVADVSHELRTPIATIRAAAETLANDESLGEDAARFVEIVGRQAAEMQDLVSDLTDLSQIEAGTVTLQLETVPLAKLLAGVARDLEPMASARSVKLALVTPEGLAVRGDRRRLAQVFRNLVDNAVKFSPEGAQVDVVAEAAAGTAGPEIRVHVVDRGIGIPASEQSRIFQRFYRVDPSRSKSTPGTGLGLAIVKHLLILHGGAVRVESRPLTGSRFTVSLPAATPAAVPVQETP
jgi:two-component system phosphate regulon sensor histidine kinase PhoR